MNIPPRTFTIKLSFENGKMRADFEEGGECMALTSAEMSGNLALDRHFLQNMREMIVDVMMERFYPTFKLPYKPSFGQLADIRAEVDLEKFEANAKEHEKNFPPLT